MKPSAEGRVPILMYHQVSDTVVPSFAKYTVTAHAFAAQMQWLVANSYTTIDLATLVAHRRAGTPLADRSIVITFDDGFRACVLHAAPVLRATGLSATVFLVAGLMGEASVWLRAERGIEPLLMTWADARALEADGHTCASHSMTHPRLALASLERCREELSQSRARIEHELGHSVREIAYPFGSENEQVRRVAAECGYEAACTVEIGLSPPTDHSLALHRVPILGTDSLMDFASRVRTGFTVRDRLRALARSVFGAGRARRAPVDDD